MQHLLGAGAAGRISGVRELREKNRASLKRKGLLPPDEEGGGDDAAASKMSPSEIISWN